MNESLAFYAIRTVPAYPLGQPEDGRPRYGMTPEMARAYRWIVENRPHDAPFWLRFSEISEAMQTERSTVQLLVVGLVERGWLDRVDVPGSLAHYALVHPVKVFKVPADAP